MPWDFSGGHTQEDRNTTEGILYTSISSILVSRNLIIAGEGAAFSSKGPGLNFRCLICMVANNCKASSRGSHALSQPPQTLHTHGAQTYRQAITHMHKINFKTTFKKLGWLKGSVGKSACCTAYIHPGLESRVLQQKKTESKRCLLTSTHMHDIHINNKILKMKTLLNRTLEAIIRSHDI